MRKEKLLIAHRGYSEIAPENTKLAFDAAKLFGFDGLEIDVHQTQDHKLVVIHDETINRTSNQNGEIDKITLKELRKINFAIKFNDHFPMQKILTYEEFLKLYGDVFKIINVEIKTDVIHYPQIEQKIWEVHQKVKPKAQIIYSSFNFKSLEILRKIDKDLLLGFLFVDQKDLRPFANRVKDVCQYLHPWFKSVLRKEDLAYYKQFKMPLNIWSIDRRNTGDQWTKDSFQALKILNKIPEVLSLISNSKV